MPYTTAEHVRPYLQADYPVRDRITNQPILLSNLDWKSFYAGAVDSSSFVVKSRRVDSLTRLSFVLTSAPVSLSGAPLVPGSIIVASDSSLGTIYIENLDYTVDYEHGTLTRVDSGRLIAASSVVVWFESFHVYEQGTDFSLEPPSGALRRLAGGSIPSGETVYVDYSPLYQSFPDDALDHAVNEANGLVEREVDPNGQFGADPTLVAAATCRALEILCRTAATRELASLRGEDRIAAAWMKLAEQYAARADRLLQSFRPPLTGPSLPAFV